MVEVIACARKGPNQQSTALAKLVLYRGDGSVGVMSDSIAAAQFVILPEKAAVDLGALYFQHQVVGNIGSELDVSFTCAEYLIQSVVRLYRSHVAMIAEVGGQALADQRPPLLDKGAQPGH